MALSSLALYMLSLMSQMTEAWLEQNSPLLLLCFSPEEWASCKPLPLWEVYPSPHLPGSLLLTNQASLSLEIRAWKTAVFIQRASLCCWILEGIVQAYLL